MNEDKVVIGTRKTLKEIIICPHCQLPIVKWHDEDIKVSKELADKLRKKKKLADELKKKRK